MKLEGMGLAAAAALLLSLTGLAAAEHPKVNANGITTEETAQTESGDDEAAELAKQLQNPAVCFLHNQDQDDFRPEFRSNV